MAGKMPYMKLTQLPRFPFELIPIIVYGVMLFGNLRVYFDSPRSNFVFIAVVSVLPWISLSWALVFNGGVWRKPTVIFSIYVILLSLAMVVLTWLNGGSEKVLKDYDPSVIGLFTRDTTEGRIVVVDGIANGVRSNIVCVYKDRRAAPGLWLRSLIFSEQIYDVDHFIFKENELDIVTRGKVPETKRVRL